MRSWLASRVSPRTRSRLRRAFRVGRVFFLGMTLGGLLFGFLLAGDIYEYQDSVDGVHLPEVDAVVCLAGGKGRIAAAADLWYRYWEQSVPENPPILYISGMGHEANWKVFSKQIRRGVLEVIRPDQVVLETESENTEENARWLLRYVKKQRFRKILLLTSSYHMKRARWMFDQVFHAAGLPVQIETLSVIQDPFEVGEWRGAFHGIRVTETEYLKWVYYRTFWSPPVETHPL